MLKTAGYNFIARFLTSLLNFGVIILISQQLGPAAKGMASFYMVVIATVLALAEISGGGATVGVLMQKYPLKQIRKVGYSWSGIMSLFFCSLLLLLQKLNWQEAASLVLISWVNAANNMHGHILLATGRYRYFNALNLLVASSVLLLAILFFSIGFQSIEYYLFSLLLGWTLVFLFGLYWVKNVADSSLQLNERYSLKEGFTVGIASQAGHIAGLLNTRLLIYLLPATALGLYVNALALAEAMLMLPGSFGQILYSKLLSEKNKATTIKQTVNIWCISLIISFLVLIVVLVIPDSFYLWLFGPGFSGIKKYLLWMVLAAWFYSTYLVFTYFHSSQGRFIVNLYPHLIGLGINAMLFICWHSRLRLSVYPWGPWMMLIAYAAMSLAALWQLIRAAGGIAFFPKPQPGSWKTLWKK